MHGTTGKTRRYLSALATLLCMLCILATYAFGNYLFAALLPDMQAAIGFDYAGAGLITSMGMVGFLAGSLISARLCALIGPENLVVLTMLVTAGAMFGYALAGDYWTLLILRTMTAMIGARRPTKETDKVSRSSTTEIPRIVTERLILRTHCAGDFEASFAMWSDTDVVRHIGGISSTAADAWSRLLRYGGLWRFLGYGYWAIEDRATGHFVGEVGFADFKRDIGRDFDGVPEAGWVISPNWAGRGYATEAMRAALEWFDQSMPGTESFCMIAPANGASIKVAQKLGYAVHKQIAYKESSVQIHLRPSCRS